MTSFPRVLFVVDSRRGHVTQRARAGIYLPFFENAGWKAGLVDFAKEGEEAILRQAGNFDVIYLVKVASYSLVSRLREHSTARLVFDFCDRLWSPARQKKGWHDLDRILAAVDAVFGENAAVCSYARVHNPRVFHAPDSAQVELFDAARQASSGPAARVDGTVVVGWVGSPSNIGALEKVREPLLRLSARHPGMEVRVLGARSTDVARILDGIPHTVRVEYDESAMVREMMAMDIGLFPPPSDYEDYRARGPLKALLYMAAGLAAVCQREGDCRSLIREGVTGMLADSPEEWERKIEALIADTDLRRKIGRAALEDVRRNHSLARAYENLQAALLEVAGFPARPAIPLTAPSRLMRWLAGFGSMRPTPRGVQREAA